MSRAPSARDVILDRRRGATALNANETPTCAGGVIVLGRVRGHARLWGNPGWNAYGAGLL